MALQTFLEEDGLRYYSKLIKEYIDVYGTATIGDPVSVEHGGTGATEGPAALENLGLEIITNEEIDVMFNE